MTTRVVAACCAKINLGLRVLGRRPDGFHEIQSVLQTIDLCDELVLESDSGLSLTVEGRYVVPADESNLVMKAARALSRRYPGRGARMVLRKSIPAGSGLGGGSSNAAAALLALARLWGLDADPGLLYSIASSLGSDVPFFLYGGTCLALGRGDEVMPMPDGPSWSVVVVWPGLELSTREVYAGLPAVVRTTTGLPAPLTMPRNLSSMKGFVPGHPELPDGKVVGSLQAEAPGHATGQRGRAARGSGEVPDVENDLEGIAFLKVPALKRLKDRLLGSGAVAAALTGSGSAVFGLYPSPRGTEKAAASLATGGSVAFVCRTLSRDAYGLNLFQRSQT